MSDAAALGDLELVSRGKVRDVYAVGDDRLLMMASDRISTYDVVHPTEIPEKGRVLCGLSAFWFERTRAIIDRITAELRCVVCQGLSVKDSPSESARQMRDLVAQRVAGVLVEPGNLAQAEIAQFEANALPVRLGQVLQ